MTTLYWPETLPLPRIEGYVLTPQPSILRTDMETGAARQRLRSLAILYQVQAEWRLTEDGFAVFEAWWALLCHAGVDWFVMPLTGGLGVQAVEARFTAPWDGQLLSANRWQVRAHLEIRELPRLTLEETEVAVAYGPQAVNLGTRLHNWLHEQLSAPDYW